MPVRRRRSEREHQAALPKGAASLYAAPPAEFVRRRNALAAELRAEGRADEAEAVRQLAKPSLAVWAINQAVRADRSNAERFITLTERLQRGPQGEAAADAAKQRRAALEGVAEAAEVALREAGHEASQQTSRRISATLEGAVADREARAALREGHLTREYDAPGFDALLGSPLHLVPKPPRGRESRPAGDRAGADARSSPRDDQRASPDVDERTRQLEAAALRRRIDAAEREERRLAALAARAEERIARLREQLRKAEEEAAEARRAAQNVARELAEARREASK